MNLDDTMTERAPLIDPEAPWLPRSERSEPDLEVHGLPSSMLSRLLRFLLGRNA